MGHQEVEEIFEDFVQIGFSCSPCISDFSCCHDKVPVNSNLRMKGFVLAHNLRVQAIAAGNLRQWELQEASHIASAVREREMDAGALSSHSPFSVVQDPSP